MIDFSTGIGRWAYVGWSLLAVIAGSLLSVIVFLVFAAMLPNPHTLEGLMSLLTLMLVAGLIMLVVSLALGALRYKDIGYHPAWILLYLVPLVNLFVTYQLLALPGGFAHTKEWDTGMKVVTVLYVPMVLLIGVVQVYSGSLQT